MKSNQHTISIYLVTDTKNNKVFLGKSTNPRTAWNGYTNKGRLPPDKLPNAPIYKALSEFGQNNFVMKPLTTSSCEEDAGIVLEELMIAYDSCNPEKGYNEWEPIRKPLTDAHKANISAANIGKILSKETRQKISQARQGVPLSNSHRESIRRAMLGNVMSEETKQKIREKLLGNTNCQGYLHTEEAKENMSIAHLKYFEEKRKAETK